MPTLWVSGLTNMYIGHRIVHAGIALISATRSIAYFPIAGGTHESAGPMILSDHGEWLWLYVTLWAMSFILSAFALVKGRGEFALLVFVFLCFSWAGGYGAAWLMSGGRSSDWMTAFLYLGLGIGYVGVHRLLDLLEKTQVSVMTTSLQIIKGGGDVD